jgi:exodeoxyribonuclease V alpha subunit
MAQSRYQVRVTSAIPSYEGGELQYNKFSSVIVSGLSKTATLRTIVEVTATEEAPFPINPCKGQIWRVKGNPKAENITRGGVPFTKISISANALKLLTPSGAAWQYIVAANVTGIGDITAQKIWEVIVSKNKHNIFELLASMDKSYFLSLKFGEKQLLTIAKINALFEFWKEYAHVELIQWLINKQLPSEISRKFALHYGSETIDLIEKNPYSILTFGGKFQVIDRIALDTFEISLDSPLRLQAAIEHALSNHSQQGHTKALYEDIYPYVRDLLNDEKLSRKAFEITDKSYAYFRNLDTGYYHPIGLITMEMVVASRFKYLANKKRIIDDDYQFALSNSLEELPFELSACQLKAVENSYQYALSIITGGGGVGKTAVTKVIADILSELGEEVILSAVSGRAVIRLQESTGREGKTIAGLLKDKKLHRRSNGSLFKATLIIDEASMIDLPTMYKLVSIFDKNISIIFVGDSKQLPPIGAGLIFHKLVNIPNISVNELTVAHRFGLDTGILEYSDLIGKGVIPELLSFKNIIFHHTSNFKFAIKRAIALYRDKPNITQIITARNVVIDSLNEKCQQLLNQTGENLYVTSADILFATQYKLNDPIIFVKNLWDLNIQNGKFGTIVEVLSKDQLKNDITTKTDKDVVFGKVKMEDGLIIDINSRTIDHFRLAHCISVHKAQGSQFEEVIVLLDNIDLVDRDWIYTAITRSTSKVHIVGSESLFRTKIKAISNASKRETYIGELMRKKEPSN